MQVVNLELKDADARVYDNTTLLWTRKINGRTNFKFLWL